MLALVRIRKKPEKPIRKRGAVKKMRKESLAAIRSQFPNDRFPQAFARRGSVSGEPKHVNARHGDRGHVVVPCRCACTLRIREKYRATSDMR